MNGIAERQPRAIMPTKQLMEKKDNSRKKLFPPSELGFETNFAYIGNVILEKVHIKTGRDHISGFFS